MYESTSNGKISKFDYTKKMGVKPSCEKYIFNINDSVYFYRYFEGYAAKRYDCKYEVTNQGSINLFYKGKQIMQWHLVGMQNTSRHYASPIVSETVYLKRYIEDWEQN